MKNLYISLPWKITMGLLLWLVLISTAHYVLNTEHSDRRIVTMGYMPIVTNLAAPLLDSASKEGDDIRFKALKFASFAEMAESLRHGQIDVAFIIAPLSIVLRQQGNDVKVVYIGNRHESALVVRKDLQANRLEDLIGKTIAVPMRFSGHNLSIMRLLEAKGLEDSITVLELNPPDMASALATGSLDAYYVGEPLTAQTLRSGDATLLHYVEDVWEGFVSNLMLVRQDFIEKEPDIVKQVAQGAARSGIWADKNMDQAIGIASEYWNQPLDLVKYALTTPQDRIVFDRFQPKASEMQEMVDLMQHFGLVESNNIEGLIDDRFVSDVKMDGLTAEVRSILIQ